MMEGVHDSRMVEKDRTLAIALVASVIVHAIMLMPFMQKVLFRDFNISEIVEPKVIPMEFELVSPPENPIPSRKLSKYLSTVSSSARDDTDNEEKTDLPHGEGRLPFPDNASTREGAEGGGESEVPPLPEEHADLGEALRRSKFISQVSPRRELSLPEQNPDFRNPGSARASIDGISISTTAWDFAPYLLDLKHRIKQHWIPPLAFTALGAIHGYTWVKFRIMPDGNIADLEVVEEFGHESLTRSSVSAVKGGAPFRQLPEDFPDPYLEVTFGFYYLLPGDEDKFFRKE